MGIIGIIGAMGMEITYLKSIISLEEIIEYATYKFYVGNYGNLKLIVVESGVGKVNAACCTQILISKFNVTHVINYGIAGSLRRDVRICDIVIGHQILYHDVSKSQMNLRTPYKQCFYAHEFLEKIALEAFYNIDIKECNYHLGVVVSGDSFMATPTMREKIYAENKACCVDMEAAAIAHGCFLNDIPFLTIKCICGDFDEYSSEFNTEIDNIAAYAAARFTIKVLDKLSEDL